MGEVYCARDPRLGREVAITAGAVEAVEAVVSSANGSQTDHGSCPSEKCPTKVATKPEIVIETCPIGMAYGGDRVLNFGVATILKLIATIPFTGIDSHQAASHTLNPVHPTVTRGGSVSQLLFLPPAAEAAPVT